MTGGGVFGVALTLGLTRELSRYAITRKRVNGLIPAREMHLRALPLSVSVWSAVLRHPDFEQRRGGREG